MDEDPISFAGASARFARHGAFPEGSDGTGGKARMKVQFDRAELNRILNIYGRMVVAGEWRDYAMDFLDDSAIFSAYRRTSEVPQYRIEKRPRLKERQGQYAVVGSGGQILKRGHDLGQVLRILERKLVRAVAAAAE
jgi:hypothetical protein